MARKLPWANQSTTNTIFPASRPPKRLKTDSENPSPKPESKAKKIDAGAATPTPSPSPRKPRARNGYSRGRNLSSSPPPPAPPEIDAMIEGIDGDDIYMMVEDEFYSTAQTFTAHLHHAEYKRLIKEARDKKRDGPAVPDVPANATREVKDKLKRRALEERQKSGVKALTSGLLSSDVEDELDKEEEMVNDPWAGTSLAPLMRYDSGERVSLKGLEKISGATRAAQGFGPSRIRPRIDAEIGEDKSDKESGKKDPTRPRESRSNIDSNESRRTLHDNGESRERDRSEVARPKVSSAEKRPASKEMPASSRHSKDKYQIPEPTLVGKDGKASKSRLTSEAKPAPKQHKSFIDSLDDFDEDTFAQSQAQAAKKTVSPEKPRIKREGKSKEKKDRSSRYDEIPVFLA